MLERSELQHVQFWWMSLRSLAVSTQRRILAMEGARNGMVRATRGSWIGFSTWSRPSQGHTSRPGAESTPARE